LRRGVDRHLQEPAIAQAGEEGIALGLPGGREDRSSRERERRYKRNEQDMPQTMPEANERTHPVPPRSDA
jgi:hypothetical protein